MQQSRDETRISDYVIVIVAAMKGIAAQTEPGREVGEELAEGGRQVCGVRIWETPPTVPKRGWTAV